MTAVLRREAAGSSPEPFLPTLPSRWRVQRLKHAARVIPSNVDKHTRGDEIPVRLCNYTDVYYNQLITSDLDLMAATATPSQLRTFGLRAGDTIVTKDSETADDIAIPTFVPEMLPRVVCGYHLSIVRPRPGVDGRFLSFLFQSRFVRARVETLARGLTRVGLGQHALDNLSIPIPPLDEQRRIAAFLDHETRRIDELVQEQERLVDLLVEQRGAAITTALTGASGPDLSRKRTSNRWFATIPDAWYLSPLKWLVERNDGGVWGSEPEGRDDSFVLRSTEQTVDGQWRVQDPALRKLTPTEKAGSRLQEGDLLITKSSGSAEHIGKTTLVDRSVADLDACFSNFMQRLRLRQGYLPQLAWYVLNSSLARQQFSFFSTTTSGLANLNGTIIGNVTVPVPPMHRQREIVDNLEQRMEKWGSMLAAAKDAIELLRERRSALITAAVTGHIDLHDWQPSGEPESRVEGVASL